MMKIPKFIRVTALLTCCIFTFTTLAQAAPQHAQTTGRNTPHSLVAPLDRGDYSSTVLPTKGGARRAEGVASWVSGLLRHKLLGR